MHSLSLKNGHFTPNFRLKSGHFTPNFRLKSGHFTFILLIFNKMIARSIEPRIKEHFRSSRNALFLTGARQVGKTSVVHKFAAENGYKLVEFNFLLRPESARLFQNLNDVSELLLRISATADSELEQHKTIIFFDEIQEFPDAVTWIKALVLDGRYRYVVSGSLLGVEMRDIRSVPVGFMTEMKMFPLDFEEFVKALGVRENVLAAVRKSWVDRTPLDGFIHDRMMRYFNLYLLVGGMPAAVQQYIDTNDLQKVIAVQKSIISMYQRDISRYNKGERFLINEIFDLIPSELNAKNKRFILKSLNQNAKFIRRENDFLWLRNADMALPAYNVEEPRVPLKLNEQRNLFKLFQNDVGLLAAQYSNGIQLQILQGDVNINFGAIYENVVAQELHAHGWNLYYFNSKKQGEVDFLLEEGSEILPLEVKSGKDYSIHHALNNILGNGEYAIRNAYVLCNDNVKTVGSITYLPIYMVMFIQRTTISSPLIYRVD